MTAVPLVLTAAQRGALVTLYGHLLSGGGSKRAAYDAAMRLHARVRDSLVAKDLVIFDGNGYTLTQKAITEVQRPRKSYPDRKRPEPRR